MGMKRFVRLLLVYTVLVALLLSYFLFAAFRLSQLPQNGCTQQVGSSMKLYVDALYTFSAPQLYNDAMRYCASLPPPQLNTGSALP